MKLNIVILIIVGSLAITTSFKISGRIAHGNNAVPMSAPYMLSFQLLSAPEKFNHLCGGSIINSYWALTAAHCFNFSNDTDKWEIKAGRYNIDAISEFTQQTRKIVYVKIHDGYKGGAEPTDIALARVNEPFIFNGAVQPIHLPSSNVLHTGNGILFGWGLLQSKPPKTATILQTGVIPIMPLEECSKIFGGNKDDLWVTEANICVADIKGVSACSADSGGPFVQFNTKTNAIEQIGVVAWGTECGQPNGKSVGVYTKVSYYIDWIEEVQQSYKEKHNF